MSGLSPASKAILLLSLVLCIAGCKSGARKQAKEPLAAETGTSEFVAYNNPPAEGFNLEGSDQLAMLLADKVMQAMGGRKNWDDTRYISWNFFGRRKLLWDKQENRVRIDTEDKTIVVNMDDMTGKVWTSGGEVENADSLAKYLEQGRRIWINDSYWLVMPFKLKDSGVTLTYVGEDTTQAGERSDVIRLTFDHVGVTPENAYEVWISIDTKLVKQWAWYRNKTDAEPVFMLPWDDYRQYGDILLSGERGERDLTEIRVLDKVPRKAFTAMEPIVYKGEKS